VVVGTGGYGSKRRGSAYEAAQAAPRADGADLCAQEEWAKEAKKVDEQRLMAPRWGLQEVLPR
jgi:hypothetical protein